MKTIITILLASLFLYTCNPDGSKPNKAPEKAGGISKPTIKDTLKVERDSLR